MGETPVRNHLVLAAVLGAGLLGLAGTAHAQEHPPAPGTVTETFPEITITTEPSESFPEIPIVVFPDVTAEGSCADDAGVVVVTLTNPNDVEVTWVVELSAAGTTVYSRSVTVGPDASATGSFTGVRPGAFDVLVRYDGRIANTTTVSVGRCGEDPGSGGPTTTSTTATSTTTATTTTPAPRPRSAAQDGGLADTGAAVGGLTAVAVLALAAGGGLLLVSRRRRAARDS
jgi:hypothetical protein